MTGLNMDTIPQSEYDRYNADLDRLYGEYLQYVRDSGIHDTLPSRLIKLELELSNTGTVPAEDVELFLHFPDGFEMYLEEDLPGSVQKPNAPEPPRKTGDLMRPQISAIPNMLVSAGVFQSPLDDAGPSLSLRKTNSYDAERQFSRIKHGYSGLIEPMMVVFGSQDEVAPFNFSYEVTAANLPLPISGTMHVAVTFE